MKPLLRRVFAIDPRSLGLFRICLGISLALDLSQQAELLGEMTTDAGSLPRALHQELYPRAVRWSLHLLGGSWEYEAFLCALTFVALGAFILGYRTRWATLAVWVLLTSLHNRHPLFDAGSDSVRRLMLFWGFFLPLGCRFSLDRRSGREGTDDDPVFSVASAAILLQVVFIYLGAAVGKDYDVWVRQGTASFMAMRLDIFATRFGKALLEYPTLLQATSRYTWWLEIVMPFVALCPFYNGRLRLVAVASFFTLHAGLFFCMVIGAFASLMMAVWLLFLPPLWWSWLAALFHRAGFVGRLGTRVQTLLVAARGNRPNGADHGESGRSWVDGNIGRAVTSLALVLVVLWNLGSLGKKLSSGFPWLVSNESVTQVMRVFKLTQTWNLFSPYPSTKDGWLMVVATLRDGSEVDLFREGRPVVWTKPKSVGEIYSNTRYSKYAENLISRAGRKQRPAYAEMHVRRWNAGKPESRYVEHIDILYMSERTLPDLSEAPLEKDSIWKGTFR